MNISRPLTSSYLSLQWGITSCNEVGSAQDSVDIYEYQDTVAIIPSPKNKTPDQLINGKVRLALGKIQNYEGKDKIEKNLLSQIATYNKLSCMEINRIA